MSRSANYLSRYLGLLRENSFFLAFLRLTLVLCFNMSNMQLINVLIGLGLLWLGSQILVKGALAFAKRVGWSDSFVGLSLLSLYSNFPEIAISVTGAVNQLQGQESAELVIGNILGSSLSHITLVLGLVGMIKVLKIEKNDLVRSGLVLILSTGLLVWLSVDGFISQAEGWLLLGLYLGYLLLVRSKKSLSKAKRKKRQHRFLQVKNVPSILHIVAGLVVILFASDWVLESGSTLADSFGISQTIVGVFILGLGNSLPELFVALQSLKLKSDDLSISTLIGSNIVGMLLAVGSSAALVGWRVDRQVANFDMPFLLLASVIVVLFLMTKNKLERKESFLLLAIYGVYAALKALGY